VTCKERISAYGRLADEREVMLFTSLGQPGVGQLLSASFCKQLSGLWMQLAGVWVASSTCWELC
jgi:hypothetical protein